MCYRPAAVMGGGVGGEGHERIPSDATSHRLRMSPSPGGPGIDVGRPSILAESPHGRYL